MSGTTIKCVNCGEQFLLSFGEASFLREWGLSKPKRCNNSRSHRRYDSETGNRGLVGPPVLQARLSRSASTSRRRSSPSNQAGSSRPPHSRPPRRGYKRWWANPYIRFGLISISLIVVIAVVLVGWIPGLSWLGLLFAGVVAVNVITFSVYRYDKGIAGGQRPRVPELVLLLLAAIGGSLMAYVAMFMIKPRHKTQKFSFQLKYWFIVAGQVLLVCGFLGFWYGLIEL